MSPVSSFQNEKKLKILGTNSVAECEKQSKHGATQSCNFCAYYGLATLTAVSLQLYGMLMIWKIQQVKQDDAMQAALSQMRNYSFIP